MGDNGDFLEWGNVEPHAGLLGQPGAGQQLFKIMRLGDFVRSVAGNYLHFQRVDNYKDFPTADSQDGDQPPRDRAVNAGITFEKAPHYSVADYYDNCRGRTYGCSFSLENSDLIWQRYGEGDPVGKICVVFDFTRLKAILNDTIGNGPGRSALMVGEIRCKQVFFINYGVINYVESATIQANTERLVNPVIYVHMKDAAMFAGEKELRITLATLGLSTFALADGRQINFPESMQLDFDFRKAFTEGTITRLMCKDDVVRRHLETELARFRVRLKVDGG
jgi:hypothetical protein